MSGSTDSRTDSRKEQRRWNLMPLKRKRVADVGNQSNQATLWDGLAPMPWRALPSFLCPPV